MNQTVKFFNRTTLIKSKIVVMFKLCSYLDPNDDRNLCSDFNLAFLHDILSSSNVCFFLQKWPFSPKSKKKNQDFLDTVIGDLDRIEDRR